MDRVVVYAGTKNIYDQMYVALKSLLANNLIDRVYLLLETDTFSYFLPENVHIINVSNQDYFHVGSANFNSPWSYMAMMKCVLSDIFPKEQKILWLDCDTIVNADISELFDSFQASSLLPQVCPGTMGNLRHILLGDSAPDQWI